MVICQPNPFHLNTALPTGLLTTATNWEFSGYVSLKLVDVEPPLKLKTITSRASLGSAPYGTRTALYGGCPEPMMDMVRSEHCWGVLLMVNENPEEVRRCKASNRASACMARIAASNQG